MEYLGRVPDDEWPVLLREHLDRADTFRLHTPDGEGPLSAGRTEFQALPRVEVRPWTGMRDAIEIEGPLTPAARELFTAFEFGVLWDYQLVQDGTVVLSVGDFHDLQIEPR
ncbi:hypothetical protein [Actinoplanes sp. NPDC051494]|uniref:hypothetical protein n=1 Tax=Actinoplanes sp. NPDC051494 TaxID=3363907 RepID=UPI0037A007D4